MPQIQSRTAVAASITLLATLSLPVQAMTVNDNYIGADDHGHGDVIGLLGNFEIFSADITRSGNTLMVSINTNFAGKGDDGLFSGITNGMGIGYGDLFLASSWSPFGTAPYAGDDNSNGTVWSHGYSLDNRWMAPGAGTGTLYRLNAGNNNANALLSDDFLTGGTYRNGQEVAVDTATDVTAEGNGSWSVDSDSVDFTIDLTGTSLANSNTIAFHWAMTCANDTIEGEVSAVPLPGAAWLMLSGLFGLISFSRRKRA